MLEKHIQAFDEILKNTSVEEIIYYLPKEVYFDNSFAEIYQLHITYKDEWVVEYSKKTSTCDPFFDKPILKCTHTNLVYALLKLLNAVFSNPLVKEYDEKAKQFAKRLEGYKNLLIKY